MKRADYGKSIWLSEWAHSKVCKWRLAGCKFPCARRKEYGESEAALARMNGLRADRKGIPKARANEKQAAERARVGTNGSLRAAGKV